MLKFKNGTTSLKFKFMIERKKQHNFLKNKEQKNNPRPGQPSQITHPTSRTTTTTTIITRLSKPIQTHTHTPSHRRDKRIESIEFEKASRFKN